MKISHFVGTVALAATAWFTQTSLVAPQGGGPEKVVKSFLTAVGKGDFDKAKKYGDENTGKVLDLMKMMMEAMPKDAKKITAKVSTVECTVDGETALCTACCNGEGNPLDGITAQKVNGKWLVSMNKEDMNKEALPEESPAEED